MTILYTLLCILLLAVLGTAAYLLAGYHERLRRDNEELKTYRKDAEEHIAELQADIEQMRIELKQDRQPTTVPASGWDAFNARG